MSDRSRSRRGPGDRLADMVDLAPGVRVLQNPHCRPWHVQELVEQAAAGLGGGQDGGMEGLDFACTLMRAALAVTE